MKGCGTGDQHDTRLVTDLVPDGMPADRVPAWVGGLQWAVGDTDMVNLYRADTGDQYRPAETTIDQMVDDAVDREWKFVQDFARWFNANVWGDLEADARVGLIEPAEPTCSHVPGEAPMGCPCTVA